MYKIIYTKDGEKEQFKDAIKSSKAYNDINDKLLVLLSYIEKLNNQAIAGEIRDIYLCAQVLPGEITNELFKDNEHSN